MSASKDINLVDSNNKGGDWFQIHNIKPDAKIDGMPHTHFPEHHDRNRTRGIKRTDGRDLDKADNSLRSGEMRERTNRRDTGG